MQMYEHDDVKKEYNRSASEHKEEYKKVMWASHKSMLNRFYLAMSEIDFNNVKDWLDVGCGTGEFQHIALRKYPHLNASAIDICEELFSYARKKLHSKKVHLTLLDYMDYEGKTFDLITCIGVLQKTSFTPEQFFRKSFNLLNPGGKIFLDTKNVEWEGFKSPGIEPDGSYRSFSPEHLYKSAGNAGLNILKFEGFLPEKNEVVLSNKSRTIFMVCQKEED